MSASKAKTCHLRWLEWFDFFLFSPSPGLGKTRYLHWLDATGIMTPQGNSKKSKSKDLLPKSNQDKLDLTICLIRTNFDIGRIQRGSPKNEGTFSQRKSMINTWVTGKTGAVSQLFSDPEKKRGDHFKWGSHQKKGKNGATEQLRY